MVDLLREDAAHNRATVLEGNRGMVGDRLEQRPLFVGEGRVAVADELPDSAALPAQRQANGVRAGAALRPGDLPVLEHEGGTCRAQRLHRGLHDGLERLLEVERLGDRLGDPRERLELGDAALGALVEACVLDRLCHLRRDRDEEVHLRVGEGTRLARPHVERAFELLPREDGHGEDRLVLVFAKVRKLLEARVEMRLLGDHDRRAFGRRRSRDSLARPHARRPRHLLDPASVGRTQYELVRGLVVQIDEARIGRESVCDLASDELEHLLQIERRVDGCDGLGQQAQVPRARVHLPIVAARVAYGLQTTK